MYGFIQWNSNNKGHIETWYNFNVAWKITLFNNKVVIGSGFKEGNGGAQYTLLK